MTCWEGTVAFSVSPLPHCPSTHPKQGLSWYRQHGERCQVKTRAWLAFPTSADSEMTQEVTGELQQRPQENQAWFFPVGRTSGVVDDS